MDKYRDCQLKDVRLEGVPGEKMNRFLQFRVLSDFAKKDIFGEARSPIERRPYGYQRAFHRRGSS